MNIDPQNNDSRKEQSAPESTKTNSQSNASEQPQVIQKVDQNQLQHFVRTIKSAEQQVGENIIQALSHDDTVAVLTSVIMSPSGQQIVSAALDPQMMQQVQKMLMAAQQTRKEEVKCMGFHCFIEPNGSDQSPSSPDPQQAAEDSVKE